MKLQQQPHVITNWQNTDACSIINFSFLKKEVDDRIVINKGGVIFKQPISKITISKRGFTFVPGNVHMAVILVFYTDLPSLPWGGLAVPALKPDMQIRGESGSDGFVGLQLVPLVPIRIKESGLAGWGMFIAGIIWGSKKLAFCRDSAACYNHFSFLM